MASYTKGQMSSENIDSEKATKSYLKITQDLKPVKMNFSSMLGREDLTDFGKRSNIDLTENSIKVSDLRSL